MIRSCFGFPPKLLFNYSAENCALGFRLTEFHINFKALAREGSVRCFHKTNTESSRASAFFQFQTCSLRARLIVGTWSEFVCVYRPDGEYRDTN